MKKIALLFLLAVCVSIAFFAQAESEWEWEILADGTARITGYAGGDAEELTIPKVVEGYSVTAVAENALAGIAGLRTVTIPQRVREIGENALGRMEVEVRGWNGSYAQTWAAEQGMNFHNLSFYNLFDGVVDLSGTDMRINGDEITLDVADTAGVTEGRMIVRNGDENITDLQAFEVTGVRTENGKATLTVKAQEPLAAVESYRLEMNDVVLGDEETRTSRGMSTVPENGKTETSVTYTAKGRSVTITHRRKIRVQGYYEYKFSQKQQGYFQIVTEDTVTSKTQGMTSVKEITKDARDFIKSMKAVTGGGNLLSTGVHDAQRLKDICKIGAKTKVDLSAAAIGSSKYTLRTTKVVRIDGDDVTVIREEVDEDEQPEMEMSGYIKIGLDTTLGIDLQLGSNLSIGSNTALTLKVEEAPQYDNSVKCYDAKVVYTSGFGVQGKLGLTTPKDAAGQSVSVTFKKVDLPMGPQMNMELSPFNFHLEFRDNPGNGFPSVEKMKYCSVLPKDQYVIRFHTGTYTQIENIYGKAGNTIKEPEKAPVAASPVVTFQNWSTDPIKNEPFDFSAPLPEVNDEEALSRDGPNVLDLWAMWSKPYRELTIDLNYDNIEPTILHILPGEYVRNEDRPVTPLRKQYRFLRWEAVRVTDGMPKESEWNFLGDPMPDFDIKVTALWEYDENYDPVEEAVTLLEEDEELRERMNGEFYGRSYISTEMQGMGAHSAFNNWRILNYGLYGITGYIGDSPVVVIPETVNGGPVVYLDGRGWENKASLQALVVPSTTCIITGFNDFPNLRYVLFKDQDRVYTGAMDAELRFVGVETICDGCFQNCAKLETINFPKYLHSIGKNAFKGTAIREAPLAMTSCVSIGNSAFESCSQLTTVTLPVGVEWLNEMVFAYCQNLKHINLQNVKAYCYGCLASTGFEVLELPDAYKLADDIVTACYNLKRLKIVLNETSIDVTSGAISHVDNLQDIELVRCALTVSEAPKLVTYSVTDFDYSISSKQLYSLQLSGLPSLKQVKVKDSTLNDLTISDCENLQTIDMEGSRLWVEGGEDYKSYWPRRLYLTNLPKLSTLNYDGNKGTWIEVRFENVGLPSLDMREAYLQDLVATDCPNLKEIKLSELPEVVNVQTYVQIKNTGIEELALPTGQGSISLSVSNNAQLKKILLPNSLTVLDGGFSSNPELSYVRLPENDQIVLKKGCFGKCSSLRELTIPACWTAEQLHKDLLEDSYVACLKVDGNADVSNVAVTDELFVAETTEGSAAWNTLQEKGFLMRPSGAAWRAARFKYIVEKEKYYDSDTVVKLTSFDHPDQIGDSLIQTTPGKAFIMPAVVLNGKYQIVEYTAGNRTVTDPMIAPDGDITIRAKCAELPDTTYELTDGGIRLTSITNSSNKKVLFIPEAVDGYPVVEVDPSVYTAGQYISIRLPSTLLRVSGADFAECTALETLRGEGANWTTYGGLLYGTDGNGKETSLILCPQRYEGVLTLPDTVTAINSYAIKDVDGLTELSGNGLEILKSHAVTGYNGIAAITFAAGLEEIQADNFRSSPLEGVTFAGDPVITDDAFVPASMVSFYGPENATNLIAWADRNGQKYNLYELTMINGGSETTLEVRAGSSLSSYDPNERDGNTFLGWSEDADADAEEPTLITVMPARNVRVEAVWKTASGDEPEPIQENNETTVSLVTEEQEDGTLAITRYKGKNNRPYIPSEIDGKAVTAIADYAFAGDQTVAVIILPESITSIGTHAFDSACALVEIEFKASEVNFGESALANCDSLRTVCLPAGQKNLPKRMFAGSRSLAAVEIPETVTEIGEGAFAGCTGLYTLTLPARLADFNAACVWNAPLRSINVSSDNEYLTGDGTAVWTADGKTLVYVCPTPVTADIPATITTIRDYAMHGCERITKVTLPEGLTTIGEGAFMGSGLKSAELPKTLKTIGSYAFKDCDGPDTVYIPDSVTEIGEDIFGDTDVLVYADSDSGTPYKTLSEKYKVLVQAVQTPVTGISFAESEITLKREETVRLTPVFEPAGAVDSRLFWSLGENTWGDIVELSQDGTITGIQSGTQKLYVETARGLRAEIAITVSSDTVPEPQVLTDVTFSHLKLNNSFRGFFGGVAYLEANAGGNMTASIGNQSWSVSNSWFEISCPEYPGLFEAGSSYSYYVRSMPEGKDVVDCTMVIVGTGEKSMGFRKEYRCRVFREILDIDRAITLPVNLSLFIGDSVQVNGYKEGMFDTPFCREMGYCFTSSNPEVAEVDETGHIQAKKAGTTTIRVAGMTNKGECVILVRENEIEMEATLSSERILQGKTETLTTSVSDHDVTIEYSSDDEKVVTVSADGKINYQSKGDTLIHVNAIRNGRIVAGRSWQVKTLVPYTDWDLSGMTDVPGIGNALTASIISTNRLTDYAKSEFTEYSADSSTIHWVSSDESILSIDEYGNATAHKSGVVTLRGKLEYNGKTMEQKVCCDYWNGDAYIEWANEDGFSVPVGESKPLEFVIKTVGDGINPIFATFDNGYGYGQVTVDENGMVTGVEPGGAYVTVKLQNRFGCDISFTSEKYVYVLSPGEASSIDGLPQSLELFAGETVTLADGNTLKPTGSAIGQYDQAVSDDESIAQVSATGKTITLTALKPGMTTARIKLYHGEKYVIPVTVKKPVVYGAIENAPKIIITGKGIKLKATEMSPSGTTSATWSSSDTGVVNITSDGTATGVKPGVATISMTVTDSASGKTFTERAEVRVTAALSGFRTESYTIAKRHYGNYFLILTAANTGDDPNELVTRTKVESAQGNKYTVKYGDPDDWDDDNETVLYLSCSDYPNRYDRVTLVTDNGDTSVRSTFDLGFDYNSTLSLKNQVVAAVGQTWDPNEAITNYSFTLKPIWTVGDSTLIRTNTDGTLTALASGETTLTASAVKMDGTTLTAETQVKINEGSLTAISRSGSSDENVALETGKYSDVGFYYAPASAAICAEAADSDIVSVKVTANNYSETNEGSVYGSVRITALKEGNTAVTVHGAAGEQLVIPVTVTPSFKFETNLKNQSRMPVGSKVQIQVICTPADPDAEISYRSESKTFTVDENGLLTAVGVGSTRIYVTVKGKEEIYVLYADESYDIASLSPNQARMSAGEALTIQALGKDGKQIPNYQIVWSSSDSSVVQVNSSGVLTAVQDGTATITAKNRNGLTSATLSVSVSDNKLNTLRLPNALKTIDEEAFAGMKEIQSVTIGNQVTSVGAKAFAGCTGLVEVFILNEDCNVDPTAFANCSNELVIYCTRDSAVWKTCSAAGLTVAER